MNLPLESAHIIQRDVGSLAPACEMDPKQFIPEETLYILTCMNTVLSVDICLFGGGIFNSPGLGNGTVSGNKISVGLSQYMQAHVKSIVSCPNGTRTPNEKCVQYNFDVFRKGGDLATLSMFGLESRSAEALFMSPSFNKHIFEYHTEVALREPFSIIARSAEYQSLVGIEYGGVSPALSGLGKQNGCHLGMASYGKWDLPGFDSTGIHFYTICAIAPDEVHMLRYTLNVTVVPTYSEMLDSIVTGPYSLCEKFDAHRTIYEVKIPQSHFKEQVSLTIKVRAQDSKAKIGFSAGGQSIGKESQGTNSVVVQTKDNHNLGNDKTPEWSMPVTIKVISADGRTSMEYTVKVKQEVSNFCMLKDITMGETNCSLTPLQKYPSTFSRGEAHPALKGFSPNHTIYSCVFDWATGKNVEVMFHQDTEKCADCQVVVPDPLQDRKLHLSLHWPDAKKIPWNSLGEEKQMQIWKRELLYGEYHTLPVKVISADKYTECDYSIYVERWAPWYMRVAVTRFISESAIIISSLMSLTGAANFMALMKQVQFMSLTTQIEGVPQLYADFTKTLKADGLDLSSYLPDFGLPGMEDFSRFKDAQLEKLRKSTGIAKLQLLTHYSFANKVYGRIAANAILHAHENDAKELLAQMAKSGEDPGTEERRLTHSKASLNPKNIVRNTDANRPLLRGAAKTSATRTPRSGIFQWTTHTKEGEYPDIWLWSEEEWDKLIKRAKTDGVTETTYPEVSWGKWSRYAEPIIEGLVLMHEYMLLESMLKSTTGSFLILICVFIALASVYTLYWTCVMKNSQKRPRLLEPESFWLFVLDYALIGFAKNSALLCFQKQLVTFFLFKPHRWMVQLFCLVALISYPVVFVIYVLWCITRLTGRPAVGWEKARLVYNSKNSQWMDAVCNDLKVTIKPKVAASVPLVPMLITQHVRSCVPVLDHEGARLMFDDNSEEEVEGRVELGTKCDRALQLRKRRKAAQMEDQFAIEQELERMDKEIQAELAIIASSHNTRHLKNKEERLKKEAHYNKAVEDWKRIHAERIRERRQKLRELSEKSESTAEPPWFAAAVQGQGTAEGTIFRSWVEDEDKMDLSYMNINLDRLIDTWESRKNRDDNDRLDAEERVAILQYIENQLREEKKLLRYQILSVVADGGYLKPKEPLKVERRIEADMKVKDFGLSLRVCKDCPAIVEGIERGSWAEKQCIQEGNEVLELNGASTSSMTSDAATRMLESERPLKLKLRMGPLEGSPERLGLPDQQSYLREDPAAYGHHPWLEEYLPGGTFIENELGERLVYLGDSAGSFGLGWMKTGWRVKAGRCEWMAEPEGGWAIWEAENLADRGAKKSTMRYADKWQWIVLDFCDSPWDNTESREVRLSCCGRELCSFSKGDIPFHAEASRLLQIYYADRVPSFLSAREKLEIRLWLWGKLKIPMELKLKLSFLADQHPKFYRERSLLRVAAQDFHQIMFEIETATPNDEWIQDFGHGEHSRGSYVSSTLTGDTSLAPSRRAADFQVNKHELLEYTLMKLEDTYPWEDEPWWRESDARAEDRGEIRVMFNHDAFWKNGSDPRLASIRRDSPLVPESGYASSSMFVEHPDELVGTKHYRLLKPDNSLTPILCNLTMGHVLPLMRYTSRFKLDVPLDSLDLPYRSAWQLVLSEKSKGERFSYCVDRIATLLSILCITAMHGGLQMALGFCFAKLASLVIGIWTSYIASQEAAENQVVLAPKENEAEPLLAGAPDAGSNARNLRCSAPEEDSANASTKPVAGISFFAFLIRSLTNGDSAVLALQVLTLVCLASGQTAMPKHMPENVCAFICIIISAATMFAINTSTFRQNAHNMVEGWTQWTKSLGVALRKSIPRLKEFLAGDNFLHIKFLNLEGHATMQTTVVDRVNVVIPELGIHLVGKPEVDESMPPDQQRQMQLVKKTAYYTMQRTLAPDFRVKRVRDLPRFDKDISSSLTVALTMDQMMSCAKIPQIVATIQCTNHASSPLGRASHDNYLTLFKPDDWEPEFDQDQDKVAKMLQGWKAQVHQWMQETLGAVDSQRTCTAQIEGQLHELLKRECTGSLIRDILMVRIDEIFLPAAKGSRDAIDLVGKVGYVSVLYENEKLTSDFPANRRSSYAKFIAKSPAPPPQDGPEARSGGRGTKKHERLTVSIAINSEIKVEIPIGVTKVRLALWVQLELDRAEELVAYTSEVDIWQCCGSEQAVEAYLHTKWLHGRRCPLVPFGGECIQEEEDGKEQGSPLNTEAEKSWLSLFRIRCWEPLVRALTCACCFGEPTEEEIKATRGVIEFKARRATKSDMDNEINMMLALRCITEGDSSMNLEKLGRHRDCYIALADYFGMRLDHSELEVLKGHLQKMTAASRELWPQSKRSQSAEERRNGLLDRQKRLFTDGIRRQLEDCEQMDRAIERMEADISRIEDQLRREKASQVFPVSPHLVKTRRISGRLVYTSRAAWSEERKDNVVADILLDELSKYRLAQSRSAKSILHYVMISDHLKPARNWHPDPIVPCVANIVTNDVSHVPEVVLRGGRRREGLADVVFTRQLKKGREGEPLVLHGRLVFKSEGVVIPGCSGDTWLYWDGHCRWVISPFYGVPAPYGLKQREDYTEKFMWSKDPAVTPDAIKSSWMIWARSGRPAGEAGDGRRWEEDLTISIAKHGQHRRTRRTLGSYAKIELGKPEKQAGSLIGKMIGDAFNEVVSLFTVTGETKTDPCLHECLVSLDARYISFAWKDFSIERLAPFRKLLLSEFGTYQSAWLYITRALHLPRSLATKNLANIFRLTLDLINLDDVEEMEAQAQRDQQLEEMEARAQRGQQLEEPKMNGSMQGSMGPERKLQYASKKTSTLTESKEDTIHLRSMASTVHRTFGSLAPNAKEALRGFIAKPRALEPEAAGKHRGERKTREGPFGGEPGHPKKALEVAHESPGEELLDVQLLADCILDLVDRNPRNDEITVDEIHALYDEEPAEKLLKEFRGWLEIHPLYRDIEYFWEPFSEGLEVEMKDFTKAIERLMLKFRVAERDADSESPLMPEKQESNNQAASEPSNEKWASPMHKAENIFAALDAQNMSGGISFRELRPFSGDRLEDADRSMLRFKIPLSHIKEIICQGARTKFSDDKRCLRFVINHQFENSKPWRDFRLALNPDWEPIPNNESIQICMPVQSYDLWVQVIKESEMVRPQEWVRYYDGERTMHPHIAGTYMRHGHGTQRWPSGRVYDGQWLNHLYSGHGCLWGSMAEHDSQKSFPIYRGHWERGKQHGEGTLRFWQDTQERRGRGVLSRGQHGSISKVYSGKFKNGLFHGHGTLWVERAAARQFSGGSHGASGGKPGHVPLPLLDPAAIIHFEGIFESDWAETSKLVRDRDPVFDSRNPRIVPLTSRLGAEDEQMDLRLESLRPSDLDSERFKRFLSADQSQVQKAGQPPPDLALAAYQLRGGDALHMRYAARCQFDDGAEYRGPFLLGRPHTRSKTYGELEAGQPQDQSDDAVGTTWQYEVSQDGGRGGWMAKYAGQFQAGERGGDGVYETRDGLRYEGQWAKNRRHGKGEQVLTGKLPESLGYASYKGQWSDDVRHGEGRLFFGEEGKLLYEGTFKHDRRDGKCVIYLLSGEKDKRSPKSSTDEPKPSISESAILLYSGSFLNDLPHSTDGRPMWLHLVTECGARGRFFYGQLDREGKRTGIGTIFGEDADESEEFTQCFREGIPYTTDVLAEPKTWRYVTYHGSFKSDLPHGEGIQRFHDKGDGQRSGIYTGQFRSGMRHGRGTWTNLDGSWTFRPISMSGKANWDSDLMHGIGIVEDTKHVHENVVYMQGKCQMPFTDMGPPLTGVDNTMVLGSFLKMGCVTEGTLTGRLKAQGPRKGTAATSRRWRLFGSGGEGHDRGMNKDETQAVQLMASTLGMSGKAQSNHRNTSGLEPRSEVEAELEALAAAREATDSNLPEEDVLISGGSGVNEALNGLYFKMSSTFGMHIYKMVQWQSQGLKGCIKVRFLLKDPKSKCWVIAPEPSNGIIIAPGCAFAKDEEAEQPGAISEAWYVWYPPQKKMACCEDLEIDGEDAVDKITIVPIAGFGISGVDGTRVKPGLMLRKARELYGRPVYEAETEGQFLYWMKKNGSLAEGVLEDDAQMSGSAGHGYMFGASGYWIIAEEVGEEPEGPMCRAYVEDPAATPDMICKHTEWCVAVARQAGSADGCSFEKSSTMRLQAEEIANDTTLLAAFESVDERTLTMEQWALTRGRRPMPKGHGD